MRAMTKTELLKRNATDQTLRTHHMVTPITVPVVILYLFFYVVAFLRLPPACLAQAVLLSGIFCHGPAGAQLTDSGESPLFGCRRPVGRCVG